MHINLRRFLALFFIFIFFALLPTILNYARGYRFDNQKNEMVRTGGITVNSSPRNARVYLNGNYEEPKFFEKIFIPLKNIFGLRKMGGTTPAIFQNLLPDKYEVKIIKKGYQAWSKKINVHPERVTFAENINLFLQEPEINTLKNTNLSLVKFSPNGTHLTYTNAKDNQLTLIDLININSEKLFISTSPVDKVSWSPTNESFYFKNKDNLTFIDLKQNTSTTLDEITEKIFTKIVWDNNKKGVLYGLTNNKIYQLNFIDKKISVFHQFTYQNDKTIRDFKIIDNKIWAIQNNSQSTEVKRFHASAKLTNAETSQTFTFLPSSNNYEFGEFNQNLISVMNSQTDNVYIIDKSKKNIDDSIIAKFFATNFKWDSQHKRILYQDNFEIGIIHLNLKNGSIPSNQEVLARYSQKISDVFWGHDENYIVFGLEKSLHTLEIDNRDQRNSFELLHLDNIIDFDFTSPYDFIYLAGQLGDASGIYQLKIQ